MSRAPSSGTPIRTAARRLRRQVYRYGVGLGAMLAKQLIAGPERGELVRAVPAGVRHARDPASRKNAGKPADYPRRLDWLERLGMLVGPARLPDQRPGRPSSRRRRRRRRGRPPDVVCRAPVLPGGETVDPAPLPRRAPTEFATPANREAGRSGAGAGDPAHRALIAIAASACVQAPLLVALGLPRRCAFPAVLAMLCLAPGTALLPARGRVELGLVLGASLAASAFVAQSMLWLGVWWPRALLYRLAAVCLPVAARLASPHGQAGPGGFGRAAATALVTVGARCSRLSCSRRCLAWGASLSAPT